MCSLEDDIVNKKSGCNEGVSLITGPRNNMENVLTAVAIESASNIPVVGSFVSIGYTAYDTYQGNQESYALLTKLENAINEAISNLELCMDFKIALNTLNIYEGERNALLGSFSDLEGKTGSILSSHLYDTFDDFKDGIDAMFGTPENDDVEILMGLFAPFNVILPLFTSVGAEYLNYLKSSNNLINMQSVGDDIMDRFDTLLNYIDVTMNKMVSHFIPDNILNNCLNDDSIRIEYEDWAYEIENSLMTTLMRSKHIISLMLSSSDPDPYCNNGIIGGSGDDVCCPTECGSCGGEGCSSRPGGYDNCCLSGVRPNSRSCNIESAPCNIDNDNDKYFLNCLIGVGASDVCCQLECGTCGGSECSSRPGGYSSCCLAGVRESDKFCHDNVAPCRL